MNSRGNQSRANWRKVRLRDLFRVKHGFAFKSEFFSDAGDHVILTPGNFHEEGGFKAKGEKEKYYRGPIPDGYILDAGSLLVAMTEQAEGLLGSSAIVPESGRYLHNQRLGLIVDIRENSIDRGFLYYLFNSRPVRQRIRATASGVKIRHTSPDRIGEIEASIPEVPVQRAIVHILSAYDDLIENNTRRIQILEKMAQAIYREWFVNFRFPGHEKVKLVDSPMGRIPQGWRPLVLKDICERVDYGYTASATKVPTGPKFLRITDIVPEVIDWFSVPFCEVDARDEAKYRLLPGDIVIARTGATTGYAKRLNKRHPASVFASYLVRIRVQSGNSDRMFGLAVESYGYKQFVRTNLGGSAQPQANARVLTSFPMVCPPQPLHELFDSVTEPLLDQKELLELRNANLRRTRDLLLPKLVSGQVDVSELDAR